MSVNVQKDGKLLQIAGLGGAYKDYWEMLESFNVPVEIRRNNFRGKNLGSEFTSAQKSEIKAGTFRDLWLGDYWDIEGIKWRIGDFNYWLNAGDTPCTTPHLVVMPDQPLYTAQMNLTNATAGGYTGSEMYKLNLMGAKGLVDLTFGSSYVLNHREYLSTAVLNGHVSNGVWFDSKVELPNEIQMYGSHILAASGDGTLNSFLYTIDKTQLALMKMYPRFIIPVGQGYWLRDVVSASFFAFVNYNGLADCTYSSGAFGVRPVFGITGGD